MILDSYFGPAWTCIRFCSHNDTFNFCSVFVKIYLNDSDSPDTLRDLDTAFRRAYGESNYVVPFLDRRAINVIARNVSSGRSYAERTVNDSVHPGCDINSCPEGDPTLLAIVLGTYVGMWLLVYFGVPQAVV